MRQVLNGRKPLLSGPVLRVPWPGRCSDQHRVLFGTIEMDRVSWHKQERPRREAIRVSLDKRGAVSEHEFAGGHVQVRVGDVVVRGVEYARGDKERVGEHVPWLTRADECCGLHAVVVNRLPWDAAGIKRL